MFLLSNSGIDNRYFLDIHLSPPPLMNAFSPLRSRCEGDDGSGSAVVFKEAASEPAFGSVKQYDANF